MKLETHSTKTIPNPISSHFETFRESWAASYSCYLQNELSRDNISSCTESYRGTKKNSPTQFSDEIGLLRTKRKEYFYNYTLCEPLIE